jgi:hypothetical protein
MPPMEDDFTSAALVGLAISVGILSKLADLGVFARDDAVEIVDHALYNLELTQSSHPSQKSAFEEGRSYLERLRREFSATPSSGPQSSP